MVGALLSLTRNSSITMPVFSPKFSTLEPKPSTIYDPLPQRTLEDIRDEVGARLVVRVVRKIKPVDDTKVSLALTLSKQDDAQFLRIVAGHLQHTMAQTSSKQKDSFLVSRRIPVNTPL
ncbi:hypothetical protein EWM64_g9658 [Hericium alpestre]|uniref:Uncharacterized protein n=1 Tax=Hericium alpestre TaxID=135208 RepID=A0A4Y9ZKD7_9AGAM|nr:hypothetical protein EWM64_g9658 [Hericium alpestre]